MTTSIPAYIGVYTRKGTLDGIAVCMFTPETGALSEPLSVAESDNPSFLVKHPSLPIVYAANEVGDYAGKKQGSVSAYSISEVQTLTCRCTVPTFGAAPCHLSVSPGGRKLSVSNYAGGNVVIYSLSDAGLPEKEPVVHQHEGSGPTTRQNGPHVHSSTLSPDGKWLFVCDLGIDRIMAYDLTSPSVPLVEKCSIETASGAGPRHMTFHPNGEWAYVINELDNTIVSFAYRNGSLEKTGCVNTLPEDFSEDSICADIHVHPEGKFIYGSNRGHDSIVACRIRNDGSPEVIGWYPTGGRHPRNFTLSLNGRFLLVANMDTDNIVTLSINRDGSLSKPHFDCEISKPVCILL